MPLPDNTPLSLQVPSNLGNAVQSKPKRAMIVRMSAETLEALEAFPNQPQMQVEFGDNPGIYIGETFFPMRPQKESSPHEIYLRTSLAAKPNAPLKLYANVIGKFMVERQLGEKVTDKVRQQTMVAKQQHLERQAILLDQPPIPVTKNKRKLPGSGTVVRKSAASDQLRVPSSSAIPPRKVSPLPQNPPSTKANSDVRRRLVHCLAIQPRLAEDAIRMVGGPAITSSAREDLVALLENIAEQQIPTKKGDKSPRPWALKPQTWTEVRPYEWGKLSEQERHAMARQGRMAFKALKIPESDPAWDHVRFRPLGATSSNSASPSVTAANSRSSATATSVPPQAEVKRPAVPKPKAKHETSRAAKGEILMKDESTKASRVNAIKRVEAERPSSPSDSASGAKAVVARRLPGSGYQAKKSPQPGVTAATAEGSSRKPAASVDARAPQRPLPASLPPKPAAPATSAASQARKTIPTLPPKTSRKSDESDLEREREREKQRERVRDRESDKGKERPRAREKERIPKEDRATAAITTTTTTTTTAIKRKNATQDAHDVHDTPLPKTTIPKRRKLEDGALATPSSSSSKVRDPQLPKKPVYEPSPATQHPKVQESPSLPASARGSFSSQDRPSPSSFSTKVERPKANGTSMKGRRRSPIYTSSEDEGEIPQPRKRNVSPPPPTSDRPNGKASHHRPRASYPLPTDHAALRARYQSSYADYLGAFSKVVAQKRKIEAILNGESEGEVEVMDPEELMKLSMEHKTLKEELENIHEMYTKGTNNGSVSD
ncbi:hypothetical protein F5I97DRAFT_1925479 [Phlebopus sp. FC_14]|nr:hypothetical protein F5I97DRAFT_1925479 [Phlebopus sp. FC_14]